MEDIVLFGAGGHCISVIDTLKENGKYNIRGIIDNNITKNVNIDFPIIGSDKDAKKIFDMNIKYAFICIADYKIRIKLAKYLKNIGFLFPKVIDKTAVVSKDSIVMDGTFIGKYAVINSKSIVKSQSIINTCAVVEHECKIDEYVHIAPGSIICGGVSIGKGTFVGAGTTILPNINIGCNSIIGAGSVVNKNILDNRKGYGIPYKEVN
ncbi:acetyltransferase [Clostridium sp. HCP1S3_B4]|uniref:acetyltransferase n=1 Tax=unclassified Clostridium TaxID=2614128 RepID=UPI003F89DE61